MSKCVLSKIINIIIIISSIVFTPLQFYNGVDVTVFNVISLIVISSVVFTFGWMGLLQTNDPLNRYNPFTINKKWKDKMDSSISENPMQIFELDEPGKDDLRNKKIEKLLK